MPELLEVFDVNGQPTGVSRTKQEIMRDSQWRLVIHVWIVDERGALLIQQRAHKKGIFDDLWDMSVGGGVSAGEASIDAAVRETEEELGVHFAPDKFIYLGRRKIPPKKVSDTEIMCDFSDDYLVRVPSIDLRSFKLQPDEVQAVDTLPLTETLYISVKYFLHQAPKN